MFHILLYPTLKIYHLTLLTSVDIVCFGYLYFTR